MVLQGGHLPYVPYGQHATDGYCSSQNLVMSTGEHTLHTEPRIYC